MGFSASNRGQRGKLAIATAALAISLLSVTGCGYINPQQTSQQYAASDGTQANVGPLQLRNMMIISSAEDKPGRVVGAVYNSSSTDVTLTIRGSAGSQTQVPVKKNSYTLLNESTDEAILSTTGGAPGSLVEVSLREDGTNQSTTFKVPVLDATISDYKQYLPTATPTESATPTSSATPTDSAATTPTSTPTPSGS
ncbi:MULTISPECIES: hypothetical protein [Micrococcaceae]|uniref:hypothetical protein n=1 Tax=Micrococcaceae TaxID=1268 RepID=UPI001D001454|nr:MULTISPECIES: hypothetical protein [Micrococcaceae]MCB5281066.1 hypothetical protein [Arthrobacter sp. ES1]MDJ0353127.1 hypothetical protein [Pseudarthrobacter sp. PH31-O2]WGZ79906.1 hypothetical protein QI450_01230 [Arthrobacter sp. EM1]